MTYRVCFLLLIVFLSNKEAISQPFSYLDIGISRSSFNQLSDIYSDRWDLSSVNSIQLRTPFYLGVAGIGFDFFSYTRKEDNANKINSLNASVFFGLNAINTKHFLLSSGVLIGIQRVDLNVGSGLNSGESEQFYAFALEPQVKFRNFIFFSELQYRRVFNYYRQNFFIVGLGLKYRIGIGDKV